MRRDRLVAGPSLHPRDEARFIALVNHYPELFVSLDEFFGPHRAGAIMIDLTMPRKKPA